MQKSPTEIAAKTDISIVWWNANDFYHFDANQVSPQGRWPRARFVYEEKCRRVDQALRSLFQKMSVPDIVALGEITRCAAEELRDRLLPTYRVISLDAMPGKATLQIALLVKSDNAPSISFTEAPPIVVPGTPRGTRPMAVLDIQHGLSSTRLIACHWQAQLDATSETTRFRIADFLLRQVYEHLTCPDDKNRNVMIVGDLNEEPFNRSLDALNAHRHRQRALGKSHWADADVERVHLYNTSWRFLGEKYSHPVSDEKQTGAAGTYFWEKEKSWFTLDHIIVSKGLLGTHRPFLDEEMTQVISLPEFLSGGVPIKFSEDQGKFRGLSDHLPLFGRIKI